MDAKILARMRKHAGPPLPVRINPARMASLKFNSSLTPPKQFNPAILKPAAPMAAHAPPTASLAPAAPGRTMGQTIKANWKPAAAAGAAATGLALGPTGLGADAAWHMGLVNDPSRDLGYYTKDLNSQRTAFQQREIDPLMRQYDAAVAAGRYHELPALTQSLDKAHSRLAANDFGTAARSRQRAEAAQTKLQAGEGTKSGFFRPLIGGYSTPEGAAQYDMANLKRDNMPIPYSLGAYDPETLALQYPTQYRGNTSAGSWDPRRMAVTPGQPLPGQNPQDPYYNRLFRSVGLG